MLDNPNPKRRRRNPDPAFRPGSTRSTPLDAGSFSVENLIKLNQAAASPAKIGVWINSTSTEISLGSKLYTPTKKRSTTLLSQSEVILSSPDKGPLTSYVTTPNKSRKLLPSRLIQCDDGACTLFLSEDKVTNQSLTIPPTPSSWIQKSPIPKAQLNGFIDVEITQKVIKETEALVRKRKKAGLPSRVKSQKAVMGISAYDALQNAGVNVMPNTVHWTHFVSHAFIGDASQTVENLGIATKYANMAMELVNPAIRKLLFKKGAYPAIYLSIIPEYVPGYESIRLLKSLTMVLKDAKGDAYQHKASIKFDMLSLQEVCLTDVQPIRKFITKKFANKTPVAKENDDFLVKSSSPILNLKHIMKQRSAPLSPTKFTNASSSQCLSPPIVLKPKKLTIK